MLVQKEIEASRQPGQRNGLGGGREREGASASEWVCWSERPPIKKGGGGRGQPRRCWMQVGSMASYSTNDLQ